MARKRGSRSRHGAVRRAEQIAALSNAVEPQGIAFVKESWSGVGGDTPPGFYVYRLIDPRDGSVFYVGKGQRNRAWQHEMAVRSSRAQSNKAKCARIASIIDAGCAVVVEVDSAFVLESDALQREWRLIDDMPALTNIMPGGLGKAQTPEQITLRQMLREQKLASVRQRELDASRIREIERRSATLPGAGSSEGVAWVGGMIASSSRLRYTPRRTRKQSKQELEAFRASRPVG